MAKCNTQADDMATTVNNWKTPGASDSGRYRDASFALCTTYCNYHDWGDYSYDLENLFKPHDEYEIDNNVCNNTESGF